MALAVAGRQSRTCRFTVSVPDVRRGLRSAGADWRRGHLSILSRTGSRASAVVIRRQLRGAIERDATGGAQGSPGATRFGRRPGTSRKRFASTFAKTTASKCQNRRTSLSAQDSVRCWLASLRRRRGHRDMVDARLEAPALRRVHVGVLVVPLVTNLVGIAVRPIISMSTVPRRLRATA